MTWYLTKDNKVKKFAIAAIALSVVSFCRAELVDNYNFKYSGDGQKSLLPVQVFDDGKKTIFQFRPGQRIPAIFVEQDGSWLHAPLMQDGAYYSVPKTGREFKLKIGHSEASVKYTGNDRGSLKVNGSNSVLENRSYSTAAKGDTFKWTHDVEVGEQSVVFLKKTSKVTTNSSRQFAALARKLLDAKSIDVYGYSSIDDDSAIDADLGRRRVDAIVNSLTSFGVDRSKIKVSVNVYGASEAQGGEIGARIEYAIHKQSRPAIHVLSNKGETAPLVAIEKPKQENHRLTTIGKQLYRIEKSDKSILDVLKRWGSASGWNVIGVNFPHITFNESVDQEIAYGTFLEAVEKMKEGLVRKGYTKVDGKAYSDNVIEIGVFDEKN